MFTQKSQAKSILIDELLHEDNTDFFSVERSVGRDRVFRLITENSPQNKIEFLIR